MIAHQAYFGDNGGTHNLLVSSVDERKTISHLKLNSDIPSSVNIDYAYLRGEKVDNFYVFTKTMHDPGSERPGMSFSHSIIIPASSIKDLNNLSPIFDKFVTAPIKDGVQLPDLEIDVNTPFQINRPANFSVFIDRLVSSKETLIYFGHDDFDNTIMYLWYFLPEKLRLNFSFDISGSPNEIKGNQITVVHTPQIFDTRWAGFSTVKQSVIGITVENKADYLENPEKPASEAFYQFISNNSISFNHINEFLPVSKLFDLCRQVIESPSVTLLKRTIMAIQQLIPDRSNGIVLKTQMIDLFTVSISNADMKEFMMLRNMSFDAFSDGLNKVENACNLWSSKNIKPGNEAFFPEGVKMIAESFWGETPSWWNTIIHKNYAAIFVTVDTAKAKFIWEFWKRDRRLIDKSTLAISDEKIMRENAGQINDKAIYEPLIQFCTRHQWLSLHADAVAASLPVKSAILAQITLEKDQPTENNLLIIEKQVGYSAFFDASLSIDNDPLHQVSANICIQHVTLLKDLDVLNFNWQKIWNSLLMRDQNLLLQSAKNQQDFKKLLSLAIEKKPYLPNLIKVLSTTLGNIYNYERRTEVWGVLSQDIEQVLLDKTGIYIIENFKEVGLTKLEFQLLNHLKTILFADSYIIKNPSVNLNAKIEILEALGLLTDQRLTALLRNINHQLNYFEADAVAKIIIKYSFRNTLEMVYDTRHSSNSYSRILITCKSMLSKWKQLWLGTNNTHISVSSLTKMIDKQQLQDVFKILHDLGVNDTVFNRLKAEYVAGVKGVELIDLCDRLKTYVQSLG